MIKRKHAGCAYPEARTGSIDKPYSKRDGSLTSSTTIHTTIHLPNDAHKRLRAAAVKRNVHMSRILSLAITEWLDSREPEEAQK